MMVKNHIRSIQDIIWELVLRNEISFSRVMTKFFCFSCAQYFMDVSRLFEKAGNHASCICPTRFLSLLNGIQPLNYIILGVYWS